MEKHPLQNIIQEAGYEVRSYSGRNMYGKECLGVVISFPALGSFIANMLEVAFATHSDDGYKVSATIGDAFHSMKQDDMGLDVILYFPTVPFVPFVEELDE